MLYLVVSKYTKGKFTIDLDMVEFPEFTYDICEIELLIDDKKKLNEAAEEIIEFAKQFDLEIKHVRGKVIEYLKRTNENHYFSLVKAKVVKDY